MNELVNVRNEHIVIDGITIGRVTCLNNCLLLAPSILAADFSRLGEQIKQVEKAGADYLHIDVMDGMFVPSISFGIPVIETIRKESNLVFDVHLMIEEPGRYVKQFAAAGADILNVHVEACTHLQRTISEIKELGLKAGVTLNPGTPLTTLEYVLNDVDLVLIMSVNPGFGGQKFIPFTLQKLSDLREMRLRKNATAEIEVDGGVTLSNAKEIMEAGAEVLVSGSSVFGGDIEANVKAFRALM